MAVRIMKRMNECGHPRVWKFRYVIVAKSWSNIQAAFKYLLGLYFWLIKIRLAWNTLGERVPGVTSKSRALEVWLDQLAPVHYQNVKAAVMYFEEHWPYAGS